MSLGGIPLATRIAALLSRLFEEVLLVGGSPPEDAPGRRVPDPDAPRCALRGLVAALESSTCERVLVVATDLPLLTADLLLALVAWPESDAVVPRSRDAAHPLCAVYRRSVAAEARARLEAGRLTIRDLLDAVDTLYLDPADLAGVDPGGIALIDVNTPEDRERAEKLVSAAAPGSR